MHNYSRACHSSQLQRPIQSTWGWASTPSSTALRGPAGTGCSTPVRCSLARRGLTSSQSPTWIPAWTTGWAKRQSVSAGRGSTQRCLPGSARGKGAIIASKVLSQSNVDCEHAAHLFLSSSPLTHTHAHVQASMQCKVRGSSHISRRCDTACTYFRILMRCVRYMHLVIFLCR